MPKVYRVRLRMAGAQTRDVLVDASSYSGAVEASLPHLRITEDHLNAAAGLVTLTVRLEWAGPTPDRAEKKGAPPG